MNFIEIDYINRISPNLERFRWISHNKSAMFRCPVCGDSKKSKKKTRGSIFYSPKDGIFFYNCYNCGYANSFQNFLKDFFSSHYQLFRVDKLKESGTFSERRTPQIDSYQPFRMKSLNDTPCDPGLIYLPLSELPEDNEGVIYAKSRKLPIEAFEKIYYTDNWAKLVNTIDPEQMDKNNPTDSRLVFSMKDREGNLIGIQGRAIDPNQDFRFSTIKFNEYIQKSFGLDSLDVEKDVFVAEAIIDSLFLPNSIAIVGGDFTKTLIEGINPSKVYVALDNEPRHKDTVRRMASAIDLGVNVCFWKIDSNLKDINKMILEGLTQEYIIAHIKENSASGIRAKMKLKAWAKV